MDISGRPAKLIHMLKNIKRQKFQFEQKSSESSMQNYVYLTNLILRNVLQIVIVVFFVK